MLKGHTYKWVQNDQHKGDDKGNGDDGMGVAWNTIIKIVFNCSVGGRVMGGCGPIHLTASSWRSF